MIMTNRYFWRCGAGKLLFAFVLCIAAGAATQGGCPGCCDEERKAMEEAQKAYDAACKAYAEAQANVTAAQAKLDEAKAKLDQLKAERDNLEDKIQTGHYTQKDWDRYWQLPGLISAAEDAVHAAQDALRAAKDQEKIAAQQMAAAWATLLAATLAYYACMFGGGSASELPCGSGLLPCGFEARLEAQLGAWGVDLDRRVGSSVAPSEEARPGGS
jgi:exonuclease VII small subunit